MYISVWTCITLHSQNTNQLGQSKKNNGGGAMVSKVQ